VGKWAFRLEDEPQHVIELRFRANGTGHFVSFDRSISESFLWNVTAERNLDVLEAVSRRTSPAA
jgi:hypothetical protein